MTLDRILDVLSQYRQRATYGAVADLLGANPRNLMADCPRNRRHSWIVSKATGLPTGYRDTEMDPDLNSRNRILETMGELRAWLEDPS